jgi:hypothetical protein
MGIKEFIFPNLAASSLFKQAAYVLRKANL